uniref:Heme oxygenase n=1 Tax=Hirondellea gigas TaxID=1518452 RepID=A0A6A7FUD6_9CRUS
MVEAIRKCPAFEDGCSFSKRMENRLNECKAFKNGCPFKDVRTQKEIAEIMKTIPISHHATKGTASSGDEIDIAATMKQMIGDIRKTSFDLNQQMGKCPIFSSDSVVDGLNNEAAKVLRDLDMVLTEEDIPEEKSDLEFSKSIKNESWEAHEHATTHPFMNIFMKGDISFEQYRQFVQNLYFVYLTLESEMDRNAQNEIINAIHMPKILSRVALFENDLSYLFGENWRSLISPSDSINKYTKRIQFIGENHPELLVAHHYIRYMGDLSGAQILGRKAQKIFSLPESGIGINFVKFSELPTKEEMFQFKNRYRKILDNLPLSEKIQKEIIDEVNLAFTLNTDFFSEMVLVKDTNATPPPAPEISRESIPSSNFNSFTNSVFVSLTILGAISASLFLYYYNEHNYHQ